MSNMHTRDDQLKATFAAAIGQRPEVRQTASVGMQQGRKADRSFFLLAIDRTRPDADQVRRMNKTADDPEIQELAESIRQFGVMEPLNVRYVGGEHDIYELIAGERRYAAAKLAQLSDVPV